jgi:hypothetical protein
MLCGWSVDETGSGSRPIVGFGFSGVENLGSAPWGLVHPSITSLRVVLQPISPFHTLSLTTAKQTIYSPSAADFSRTDANRRRICIKHQVTLVHTGLVRYDTDHCCIGSRRRTKETNQLHGTESLKVQLIKKFHDFYGTQDSLPCSSEPATGP